jgi:hypothetical protein
MPHRRKVAEGFGREHHPLCARNSEEAAYIEC